MSAPFGLFTSDVSSSYTACESEIVPQFIPGTTGHLCDVTVHLTEIVLTNVTGGSVTVTISDQQTVPTAVLSALPIAANSTYEIAFKGRVCPNGVTWSCSAGSSVIAAVRAY